MLYDDKYFIFWLIFIPKFFTSKKVQYIGCLENKLKMKVRGKKCKRWKLHVKRPINAELREKIISNVWEGVDRNFLSSLIS